MKDFNDKQKKSMPGTDGNNYDEYDQEVVENDEEYYAEEDETDEEAYCAEGDEEPYDEAYDELNYDHVLNQVLDELAELKRNISTPDVFKPQYSHFLSAQYDGNDSVLYNEISRLRDELSRTQSTQNLHVELSRLKEDMDREKLRNESVFVSEIKRLNGKIEGLQKHKTPSLDVPIEQDATAFSQDAVEETSNENYKKLVQLSEAILQNLHNTENRVQNEINTVKNRLDSMGNFEALNKTVAAIRKSVRILKEQLSTVSLTMQNMDGYKAFASENQLLNKLNFVSSKLSASETADLSGVTKLIYELKALIGSGDESEKTKLSSALKLYDKLEQVKAVLLRSVDLQEKLFAVDEFTEAMAASDFVNADLLKSAEVMVTTCMETLLTRFTFNALSAYAAETGKIDLSSEKQENIKKYLALFERTDTEDILPCIDFLPELVSVVDELQDGLKQEENNATVLELCSLNSAYAVAEDEGQKNFYRAQMKQKFANLTMLTVGEVVSYMPKIPAVKETSAPFVAVALTERLNELKSLIGELNMNSVVSDNHESDSCLPGELPLNRQQLLSASLKDEILAAIAQIKTNEPVFTKDNAFYESVSNEDKNLILKELNGIKEKLDLTENYDVLTEILSLREDVKTTRILNTNDVSSELEGLKGELLKLKAELISKTYPIARAEASGVTDGENAPTSDELNLLLSEIVSLRDEIQAYKDDVNGFVSAQKQESTPVAAPQNEENFTMILDELTGLRLELQGVTTDYQSERASSKAEQSGEFLELHKQLLEMKDMLARRTSIMEPSADGRPDSNELNVVLDEIINLKQGLEFVKQPENVQFASSVGEALQTVKKQLEDIRAGQEYWQQQSLQVGTVPSSDDLAVRSEVVLLRDELKLIKAEILNTPKNTEASEKGVSMVMTELLSLRNELGTISDKLAQGSDSRHNFEVDSAVLSEVHELRGELEKMRNAIFTDGGDNVLFNAIEKMKTDLRSLKDEPNLSVMSEILALRDEFQAFKDELNKTRFAPKEDKMRDDLLKEVRSLRDQMFAVSMANVNDGTSSEVVYESYNNIILDEISALRDEINVLKQNESDRQLSDELAQIKETVANLAVDEREARKTQFAKLTKDIEELKKHDGADATKNSILKELSSLKQEIANQRDADAASLDYMSEMAHLLERQNLYLTQSPNAKLSDEIESLKVEIASSLAAERNAYNANIPRSVKAYKAEQNQTADSLFDEAASLKAKLKPAEKKRNTGKGKKAFGKPNEAELPFDALAAKKENTRENENQNSSDNLDVAGKLAKQVANKLIMEQLIRQLSDGGVPDSKVEEIVKDILPQEFSTIQIDDQSDEVRRLANSLVLDKLRSRLSPKK